MRDLPTLTNAKPEPYQPKSLMRREPTPAQHSDWMLIDRGWDDIYDWTLLRKVRVHIFEVR